MNDIFSHKSYRAYLKAVLAERQARNPGYSMRAMARDLGLKPAHLSNLAKGNKGISLQNALSIAKALQLTEEETDYFCLLVQYEGAKSADLKDSLGQKLRSMNSRSPVQDLSVDLFKAIADWYHIPIVELLSLHDFEFNAENVARRLGISRLQAEVAIERLERLELIEKDESGFHRKTVDNYVFSSELPNGALQRFHRQMMEKAIESLTTQSPLDKYVGSQTFSIDPAQLPEARKIIDECCEHLVELFSNGPKKSRTYHFGFQLFNLTQDQTQEEGVAK